MSEEQHEPPVTRAGDEEQEAEPAPVAQRAPGERPFDPEATSVFEPQSEPRRGPYDGEAEASEEPSEPRERTPFISEPLVLSEPVAPPPPPPPTPPPPPPPPTPTEPASPAEEPDDPFAAWPQPESQTIVEELPSDVSVEHVAGEIDVPDGYTVLEGAPTGHRRAVAVVVSRFNGGLTNRMLARAIESLEDAGVASAAVTVVPVPGAFELPLAAMALAKTRRYACVVALGAIVRGETPHFDFIAAEAASGLQLAGIETGVPVAFGVLTVESVEQAEARIDRAADAVRTALEMADLFARLRASTRAD